MKQVVAIVVGAKSHRPCTPRLLQDSHHHDTVGLWSTSARQQCCSNIGMSGTFELLHLGISRVLTARSSAASLSISIEMIDC